MTWVPVGGIAQQTVVSPANSFWTCGKEEKKEKMGWNLIFRDVSWGSVTLLRFAIAYRLTKPGRCGREVVRRSRCPFLIMFVFSSHCLRVVVFLPELPKWRSFCVHLDLTLKHSDMSVLPIKPFCFGELFFRAPMFSKTAIVVIFLCAVKSVYLNIAQSTYMIQNSATTINCLV